MTDWQRRLRILYAVWRKRGARDSSRSEELAAALWQLRRERRWAAGITVAHLYPDNHAPDAPVVFVAALCAPCHLRLDAPRKARQRVERRWHQEELVTP